MNAPSELPVHVLRRDGDLRPGEDLDGDRERGERRADGDVDALELVQLPLQLDAELGRLGWRPCTSSSCRRSASRESKLLRVVKRRWDTDEREHGVADARQFAAGARDLLDAMTTPEWVAEDPEAHLVPNLRHACEGSSRRDRSRQRRRARHARRRPSLGAQRGLSVVGSLAARRRGRRAFHLRAPVARGRRRTSATS